MAAEFGSYPKRELGARESWAPATGATLSKTWPRTLALFNPSPIETLTATQPDASSSASVRTPTMEETPAPTQSAGGHSAVATNDDSLGPPLLKLPDELLLKIVGYHAPSVQYLERPRAELRNLSLASRRLHRITGEILYSQLNIKKKTDSRRVIPQLARALTETQHLRNNFKSASGTHRHHDTAPLAPQIADQLLGDIRGYRNHDALRNGLLTGNLDAAFAHILLLLPALEELELTYDFATNSGGVQNFHSHVLDALDAATAPTPGHHGFTNLARIVLVFDEIAKVPWTGSFLAIPSLKSVCLGRVTIDTEHWTCDTNSSLVQRLMILYADETLPSRLVTLLESFANLKELVIDLEDCYMNEPWNVVQMHEALLLQKHALEYLDVWSNEVYSMFQDPVGTPLPSLKEFVKLRYLGLTDSIIFGETPAENIEPSTAAHLLSNLFPPSLEEFRHRVWSGRRPEQARYHEPSRMRIDWWKSVWPVAHMPSQFPSLQNVAYQRYHPYHRGLNVWYWPSHEG
ncbi:hypothetical protein BDV96DRAFT_599720 [Lophiotrema nucula]|uniref:Uncharacterized protein n=1 Tax=Lophiotrema nucula TaxID=690887 RepID=A0A6A5Z873_9PLEO|nr:hypothetical protein BDV96DRAFT_599720 [Lophiotrema nucula]